MFQYNLEDNIDNSFLSENSNDNSRGTINKSIILRNETDDDFEIVEDTSFETIDLSEKYSDSESNHIEILGDNG